MGYYQTFIQKQAEKKNTQYEKKKEYNRKNARDYYWRHRDQILEKNKMKRLHTNQYYKEWYQKNKEQLNDIRNKKNKNKNKNNYTNIKPIYIKPIKTKPSFTLFG